MTAYFGRAVDSTSGRFRGRGGAGRLAAFTTTLCIAGTAGCAATTSRESHSAAVSTPAVSTPAVSTPAVSTPAVSTPAAGKGARAAAEHGEDIAATTTKAAGTTITAAAARVPANVLDLADWKLTLPTRAAGSKGPAEITQPRLATFSRPPYFMVGPGAGGGVVFRANAGGATTSHSSYPRSELRQMTDNGRDEASWSSTKGTHTMTVREAITHLPKVKPEVVAGQVHSSSDDVMMIRLEGRHLFVDHNGDDLGDLNNSYTLGTIFTVHIVVGGGRIKVYYNNALKLNYKKKSKGLYFKAGCYTQSNTSRGDAPGSYGQVVVYGLKLSPP
jgi:poly(beta-D-mannuronate) lyase